MGVTGALIPVCAHLAVEFKRPASRCGRRRRYESRFAPLMGIALLWQRITIHTSMELSCPTSAPTGFAQTVCGLIYVTYM